MSRYSQILSGLSKFVYTQSGNRAFVSALVEEHRCKRSMRLILESDNFKWIVYVKTVHIVLAILKNNSAVSYFVSSESLINERVKY